MALLRRHSPECIPCQIADTEMVRHHYILPRRIVVELTAASQVDYDEMQSLRLAGYLYYVGRIVWKYEEQSCTMKESRERLRRAALQLE